MKLVIVTALAAYHTNVLELFKSAEIENFSTSQIEGHQTKSSVISVSNWFAGSKMANESNLYFSFTSASKIENLLNLVKENNKQYSSNPVRAVVLPIENYV